MANDFNFTIMSNLSFAVDNTTDHGLIKGIPDHLVDQNILMFRKVIHCIDLYGIPIISVVGILGNIVCFLVFMTTYLRTLSSSVYLAALSVCDGVFLLTTLLSWMDNVNIDVYHRQGWCQILTYLGYVTSFLDVCYVVSFTLERYIAICFPLKRQSMCTPRRAKIVVIAFAILGLVLFNFALWTTEVGWYYERPFCSPKVAYFKTVLALSNVDTIITLIIPTVVIVTCNLRIGYSVATFYRNRVLLSGTNSVNRENSTASSSGHQTTLYVNCSQSRLQMKVTKMLLVVSSVFLICHLPSHSCRVYAFIMSHTVKSYTPSHMMLLIQKLFQHVYVANFGLNFFLYNISGNTFQKALFQFGRNVKDRVSGRERDIRWSSRGRSRTDMSIRLQPIDVKKCTHVRENGMCKVCNRYS